jgi:short subunit dehydrogenase-like uncharacterized protein
MNARDLAVVVFGATGITGRQVVAYLARRAGEGGLRWAVAARNPAKVERVLGELGVIAPETIAADTGQPESLAAMASRAKVVLNLTGPYTLRGEPVIRSCIEGGAHYMDLTGETPWVRRMIQTYGTQAKGSGVKIVNTSGFEALPVDLAVLLATETARERWAESPALVEVDVTISQPRNRRKLSDMISGGTLQSGTEGIEDPDAAVLADSAALIEDPEAAQRVRKTSPLAIGPRFGANGEVIGPMMPGPFINPAVIHRSAALLAAEEGREFEPFRYREGIVMPGVPGAWPLRYAMAAASTGFQAGFRALSRAPQSIRSRTAATMRRRLPGSGFGPTGEALKGWSWTMAVNLSTRGDHHLRVDLGADGHPGYLTTATMLGEAGLLLSEQGATPSRCGFLTPAVALGTDHLDRFHQAGLRFRVSS